MKKPIIGITMGDPSGIGPETIVKAFRESDITKICRPVVIGNFTILKQALNICNIKLELNIIDNISEISAQPGTIDIINLNNIDISTLRLGEIQASSGQAAFDYIKRATDLALQGKIDSIVTTPIQKESLKKAGVEYIGHTEIFAGLTNSENPLTMFEVNNLRIFFMSRHVSLRKACDLVKKDEVLQYIKKSILALKQLGIENTTFAVAGLNPHCGDNGLFGDEEIQEIIPAVEEAKKAGYNVIGPIGADSVFHLAMQKNWSGVLSLYHDQGHIASKTFDFERTIALTLGLPFLRTSVDHGTAFDIAGKGTARATSLIEAIKTAVKYTD